MASSNAKSKNLLVIVLVVIVGVVAYAVLTAPDRRTTGEHIADAIDQLPNGVDNAARELKPSTPAERIGDAVKDATN